MTCIPYRIKWKALDIYRAIKFGFQRMFRGEEYEFETRRYIALPPQFAPFNKTRMELVIGTGLYEKTIVNENMQEIYKMYKTGYYYPERGEFAWQKELIDMIEGS